MTLTQIFDLYKAIIYKYLMVCHKQLKIPKTILTLKRKKLIEKKSPKKEKRKMEVDLTMKDILSDTSEGKESSHLKLKVNCITGVSLFNSASFTKNDLFRLC